jgi:hypothetical protein
MKNPLKSGALLGIICVKVVDGGAKVNRSGLKPYEKVCF